MILTIFWVCVALNLLFTALGIRKLVYFFKPAVIITLIVALNQLSCTNVWLFRAMYFSLLGDIFLMLPQEDHVFIPGLISFLIAHIMYVMAFHEGVYENISVEWRITCFLLVVTLLSPLIQWMISNMGRRKPINKDLLFYLRVAVGVYIFFIAAMMANALASGNLVAIIGSLLFAFSDSLICWSNFITPNRDRWTAPAIILTYHIAQFCLFQVLK